MITTYPERASGTPVPSSTVTSSTGISRDDINPLIQAMVLPNLMKVKMAMYCKRVRMTAWQVGLLQQLRALVKKPAVWKSKH